MTDLIFTCAVIFSALLLIGIVRILSASVNSRTNGKGPKAELRIICDEDAGCLEYILGRIIGSKELSELDLKIVLLDRICTDESREWLLALKRKTGADFEIESEESPDR